MSETAGEDVTTKTEVVRSFVRVLRLVGWSEVLWFLAESCDREMFRVEFEYHVKSRAVVHAQDYLGSTSHIEMSPEGVPT